jgi:hypothetical protein
LRESDGATVQTATLLSDFNRQLLYDGSQMWSTSPLQKLKADGSVALPFPVNLAKAVYDGRYFWGETGNFNNSATYQFTLTQVDPKVDPSGNYKLFEGDLFAAAPSSGAASGGGYLWYNSLRIPPSNPQNNILFEKGVCPNAYYPLYHHKTRSLWVVCLNENAIQKIYSLNSSLNTATLAAAGPGPADAALYLPLIIKGQVALSQETHASVTPAPTATNSR